MNTAALRPRARIRTRGSVLIIVLITIIFASVALTIFIEKASNDLLVEARAADNARLRREASSALETTLAVLVDFSEVNGSLRSPLEGWGDPLGFAGYEPGEGRTVEIAFEDESGKISLPHAEAQALLGVFKSWNLSQSDAEKLADALLGWMKKDYTPMSIASPKATDYDRGEFPFLPPDRPLRSFGELASIDYARDVFYDDKGQPNDLWRRFVATFSLYDYASPSINGAAPDVLAAYGSTDPTLQQRLGDYLHGTGSYKSSGSGFFPDKQHVAAVLGGNTPATELGTEIRALRIRVTVHEGPSEYRLSALVAPAKGGARVPKISRTATDGTGTGPAAPTAPTPPPAPRPGETAGAGTTGAEKKLNYPFTILEIRENDAMPSPPVAPVS